MPAKTRAKAKLDLSQAKREPLPSGVYLVRVTDVEIKEGKQYDRAALTLQVMGGEHDGRKIVTSLSFSPKAAFKVAEFLEACGEDTTEMLRPDVEIDFEEYLDREFEVELSQTDPDDDDRGRTFNQVEAFLPSS